MTLFRVHNVDLTDHIHNMIISILSDTTDTYWDLIIRITHPDSQHHLAICFNMFVWLLGMFLSLMENRQWWFFTPQHHFKLFLIVLDCVQMTRRHNKYWISDFHIATVILISQQLLYGRELNVQFEIIKHFWTHFHVGAYNFLIMLSSRTSGEGLSLHLTSNCWPNKIFWQFCEKYFIHPPIKYLIIIWKRSRQL